jgi:hypothetical protein
MKLRKSLPGYDLGGSVPATRGGDCIVLLTFRPAGRASLCSMTSTRIRTHLERRFRPPGPNRTCWSGNAGPAEPIRLAQTPYDQTLDTGLRSASRARFSRSFPSRFAPESECP